MKPTSKILVFLAVLIFSAVMASESVNADNEVVLDDFFISADLSTSNWHYDFLLLEIDFTQGDSALVNIDVDVVSNEEMSVFFAQQLKVRYSSSRSSSEPMWTTYPVFTAQCVVSYNKQFTMTPDVWNRGTYYFFIKGYGYEEIYVDVDFSVLIDYDGDGHYGDRDFNPTTNYYWLKALEDRLRGIDDKIKWTMENITGVSSALSDNVKEINLKLYTLQLELDEFKSSIQDEVWNQAIDLSELSKSLDSLQSTLLLLNLSLAELDLETGMEFDILHEYVVNIYNNLHILEVELGVQIDEINTEVAAIWNWNNENLNQTTIELIALNNREWANNAANVQEFESARLTLREAQEDIENAQEDIEDALDEAKAARTVGLVTGLVGIIIAIVAIIGVARINHRTET